MSTPSLLYREIETFRLVRNYADGAACRVVLTVDHVQQHISITPEGILADTTDPEPGSSAKRKSTFTLLHSRAVPAYWQAMAKLIEHATAEGHARLAEVKALGHKPTKELH